jgi:hypothetical protein
MKREMKLVRVSQPSALANAWDVLDFLREFSICVAPAMEVLREGVRAEE